ncbi:MAG: hypothetical protein E6931_11670 [Clostridium botulinum]|nr:hypothetical protein [Clostridium botulinum]
MENHLYSIKLERESLGTDNERLEDMKYFLNENKELDRKIRDKFPISFFGNPKDFLRIKGSKTLIKAYEELDDEKYDFNEALGNIEYTGIYHDNELIFNFPTQEIKAVSIYNFKNEFLREFSIEKYVDFCIKNDCNDLVKENLDNLFEKFGSKEKQYRLLRDRDDEWRIRGFTSSRYNNYDNSIAVYLSLLSLHKYAQTKDIVYNIDRAYLSDSSIYILFEQEEPIKVKDIGDIYLGIAVSNGEIRNRTFKFDIRYKVINTDKKVKFSAILNNSIFSIVHSMGVLKVEECLNNLTKLDEHTDSIIKFISDLNYMEPLSNDATYMLMNDLIERITSCSDISKKTKDSFKQAEFNKIVDNTLTLIEFLNKANSIQTDIDERIFIERILQQVMENYVDKRK